jgi:hypothetical protein
VVRLIVVRGGTAGWLSRREETRVAPDSDLSTREVLAGFEDIDFHIVVGDGSGVVLRTRLRFDLHVRPATYIFGRMRDAGLEDQLSLRRPGTDEWHPLQPLGMVAQALHKGEEVELLIAEPITRDALVAVADTFRRCPLYRNYGQEPSEAPPPKGLLATFDEEFESNDGAFCLIRLTLENFIIGHLAEIESYILQHSSCALSDWDRIHGHFKSLLFGESESFGVMSLDVPLDNLMQTRDMCYHLHFSQVMKGERISYAVMNLEWGQENAMTWRRNHMRRHRYFYEREASYYRDLFLLLVLRESGRLRRFCDIWTDRLDYSLELRRGLRSEMQKVETEMENFSPNFNNPDEFRNHIRLMGELVIRDLSRLTHYVELIRDRRIYHAEGNLPLL